MTEPTQKSVVLLSKVCKNFSKSDEHKANVRNHKKALRALFPEHKIVSVVEIVHHHAVSGDETYPSDAVLHPSEYSVILSEDNRYLNSWRL